MAGSWKGVGEREGGGGWGGVRLGWEEGGSWMEGGGGGTDWGGMKVTVGWRGHRLGWVGGIDWGGRKVAVGWRGV